MECVSDNKAKFETDLSNIAKFRQEEINNVELFAELLFDFYHLLLSICGNKGNL